MEAIRLILDTHPVTLTDARFFSVPCCGFCAAAVVAGNTGQVEHGVQAVFIDSTINRAHACAAGAAGSNAEAEALGRSRGGFSTKVHALTDALGLTLGFILTRGQKSDIDQAEALLELASEEAEVLGGNKGYDCDELVEAIKARGMGMVIPPPTAPNPANATGPLIRDAMPSSVSSAK